MGKISTTALINWLRLKTQGSTPATPASGYSVLYEEGGALKLKDDAGTITTFGASTVDDTAYDATSWDGVTTTAPSKNAIRDKIESMGAGGLTNSSITPTTGSVSAVVDTRYFADISGLTADRNFVLPNCVAGNEIELKITTGDDTYELIIIGDTGVAIDGGSVATEWSRLFISGETLHFIADGADSWRIVHDGRIGCLGLMTLSGADTTNTAATQTLPTWDNAVINIGNLCDTTNKRFTVRRAGYYKVSGQYRPNNGSNMTDQKYVNARIYLGGTGGTMLNASLRTTSVSGVVTTYSCDLPSRAVLMAAGEYVDMWYQTESANMGADVNQTWFQIEEA